MPKMKPSKPTKEEIHPQVDAKLNKARKPNKPVPLPIENVKRLFEDLNIGPTNHAALSVSFTNITRKYEGGLAISSGEALACAKRGECVTLVHRRANGIAD